MNAYVDTSALVKAVLQEPGAEAFVDAWSSLDDVFISSLGYLELRSALARSRRGGRGLGPAEHVDRILADELWEEMAEVTLDASVLEGSVRLVVTHGLTSLDAIHLASALLVAGGDPMALVSFDRQLRVAAAAEGLVVLPAELP